MELLVSMTTTSRRIDSARNVVAAMLGQSLKPDEIHVWISREPYLFDDGFAEAPELPGARVHFVPNTGPFRKLLPILRRNWGRDVLIVTVDDDTRYPPVVIEALVRAFQRHGCIIASHGRRATFANGRFAPYVTWPKTNLREPREPHLLNYPLGQFGILYHPAFFTDRVFDPAAITLSPSACEPWFFLNSALAGTPAALLGMHLDALIQTNKRLWEMNQTRNDGHLAAVATHLGIDLAKLFAEAGLTPVP